MAQEGRTGRTSPPETLRGVVEATNERGIKLQGRWLNFSRYREVPHPEVGQEVEVEVVRDRFINALTITDGGDVVLPLDELTAEEEPAGDAFTGLEAAVAPPRRGTGRALDRTTESRRLALLAAAATFHAQRPEATDGDVLDTAIRWEAWVLERGLGGTTD